MTKLTHLAAAALLAATPGMALAWQADNRHFVNPVSDGVFEVVGRSGSGGPEFWCAAGDYARRAIGASATQRIYLVRGPAPAITRKWNRAVLFSLTEPQGADLTPGYTLSVTRVGENLIAASAQNYCSDYKMLDF
ncbi:MAG: hypothetical protein ACI8R4_004346 [Paracoccaceae bacterium]|jgi:hypothetical protein